MKLTYEQRKVEWEKLRLLKENKQYKIDKIYEVIADKTLSFGCKVQIEMYTKKYIRTVISCKDWIILTNKEQAYSTSHIKKTIWHPIHIWDVLDWMREALLIEDWEDRQVKLCMERTKKRFILEEQPDECIDFIFWLLNDVKDS